LQEFQTVVRGSVVSAIDGETQRFVEEQGFVDGGVADRCNGRAFARLV
jgi:hypothetical protein